MFKLIGKEIFTILRSNFFLSKPVKYKYIFDSNLVVALCFQLVNLQQMRK